MIEGRFHCDTRDFIRDAHERGESVAEIAASLRLSYDHVAREVNRYVAEKAGLGACYRDPGEIPYEEAWS